MSKFDDAFDTAFDADEFGPDKPHQDAKPNGAAAPMTYTLLRDIRPNLTSREIVKNLIPRRALGEVHADAGGGKTAIFVDLMLHVAAGMQYRARRTEQQPVVYVALEGHGGIDNRVIAAARELEIDDAPFALVKSSDNFCEPETAEKVASITTDLIKRFGGDNPVVAIDTYTAALGPGGSDCDPKDVSAFIAAVQQHLLSSCTVWLCCTISARTAAAAGAGGLACEQLSISS
jgi:RecA-family ATPase